MKNVWTSTTHAYLKVQNGMKLFLNSYFTHCFLRDMQWIPWKENLVKKQAHENVSYPFERISTHCEETELLIFENKTSKELGV